MSKVVHVNDSDFNTEVIEHKGTVLVDFYADWCGPCQMMSPILEDFSEKVGNKVKVVKVNVDNAPNTAGTFRIMSIPSLMVIKNGDIVKAPQPGVMKVEDLEEYCNV